MLNTDVASFRKALANSVCQSDFCDRCWWQCYEYGSNPGRQFWVADHFARYDSSHHINDALATINVDKTVMRAITKYKKPSISCNLSKAYKRLHQWNDRTSETSTSRSLARTWLQRSDYRYTTSNALKLESSLTQTSLLHLIVITILT